MAPKRLSELKLDLELGPPIPAHRCLTQTSSLRALPLTLLHTCHLPIPLYRSYALFFFIPKPTAFPSPTPILLRYRFFLISALRNVCPCFRYVWCQRTNKWTLSGMQQDCHSFNHPASCPASLSHVCIAQILCRRELEMQS